MISYNQYLPLPFSSNCWALVVPQALVLGAPVIVGERKRRDFIPHSMYIQIREMANMQNA